MTFANSVNLRRKICADHINHVLLDNSDIGVQMADAWGKIPGGILSGQMVSLGNFDQCLNISEMSPVGHIRGKYCLVKIIDVKWTFAGYGACVPEVCDLELPFASDIICQTKGSYNTLDTGDCVFLTLMALFSFILLLSTIYDWYTRKYELKQNSYCILFSVLTNGKKLFETKIGPDQISCLAGIRVLNMIWIVAAHRYFVLRYLPIRNSFYGYSFLFSHESFYVQAAYLAVDSFLYLGGLVLAYQCFKNRNKLALTVPTIPYFYMHRLLRLLPPMTLIFFAHLTILRRMATGPLYPSMVEALRQPCLHDAWPFFFFVHNYIYTTYSNECLMHTWYLNVDFQLYFFTPIILIPATKLLNGNQKRNCYYLFFWALVLSIIIPILIMIRIQYQYAHAHLRVSPYIMGMIMGLFLVENKDKTFKINTILYYFMWLFTFLLMAFCVYNSQDTLVYQPDTLYDNLVINLGRPAWSLAISWIIFCCINKNAKILNKFLSNSLFIIMGRLSYSMYLLQVIVLMITMGPSRTPMLMSFWSMLHGSVCDVFLTTIFSIVCVLTFESPSIALAKLLLNKREPEFFKQR